MRRHFLLSPLLVSLWFSAGDFKLNAQNANGHILRVDSRGGAQFRTLAEAAKSAQPGDAIQVVPGSGPYREILFIRQSGRPDAPITFDGGGETVTGFDVLNFVREGDAWTCDLRPILDSLKKVQQFHLEAGHWVNDGRVPAEGVIPTFPSVLSYRGERLRQDAGTGQFTKYATLSPDATKLTLLPGVSPQGWELATRPFAVRIYNSSWQTFRNVKASGSLNDGVNLHGAGDGLVFENIEAFNNIDEGFSAHDQIHCEIRNGKFQDNDNGICNAPSSFMKASHIEIFSNLGWGFGLKSASALLDDVKIWNNGMDQFVLEKGAKADCTNVLVYTPPWKTRQWVSSQESRRETVTNILNLQPDSEVTGTPPQVIAAHEPATK